jgi:hypothetical protein
MNPPKTFQKHSKKHSKKTYPLPTPPFALKLSPFFADFRRNFVALACFQTRFSRQRRQKNTEITPEMGSRQRKYIIMVSK